LLPPDFIRETVQDLITMFYGGKTADYARRHYSYLLYYLPINVFKIWKPLCDLQINHALKPTLHVLDVGSGPGSVPLGITEYFGTLARNFPELSFELKFDLLEAEGTFLTMARALYGAAREQAPQNLEITLNAMYNQEVTNPSFSYLSQYDLITISNFFTSNEGQNQKRAPAVLASLAAHLRPDGSLIVIEPGEERHCLALKRLRNEVLREGKLKVFAPCQGLWEEKTVYNCACFGMTRSYWAIPRILTFLADHGLTKANREDVPFNYLILRKDGLQKYAIRRNRQHYVQLKDLRAHAGARVNVMGILRTVVDKKDRVHVSLCDGSCGFSSDNEAVWVTLTQDFLARQGITERFLAAERLTLKGAVVTQKPVGVDLVVDERTTITVDF
jgi:SAM-dependent methyltransferase